MVCLCECIVLTYLVIKSLTNSSLGGRRLGIQIQCWYRSAYAAGHLALPALSCYIFALAARHTISSQSSTSAFSKHNVADRLLF